MLLLPKNIFLLCDSTVHPVNFHIIRPNDRKTHARCKLKWLEWTEGEWAQSIGKAFFMVEIRALKILH